MTALRLLHAMTEATKNYRESAAEALHQRYFGDSENKDMGERIRLLRKIIKQTQKKQSTYYRFVILTIGLLLLAVNGALPQRPLWR